MAINNINLELDSINSSVALSLTLETQEDVTKEALKHKVHSHLAAVVGSLQAPAPSAPQPSVGGTPPYPIDPNQPMADPSIPLNPDGSVNFGALQSRIREMIVELQSNPENLNVANALFQLMANLKGVYGQLTADQKDLLNRQLGVITQGGGPFNESLGQAIIASMVQAYFFQTGDQAKTLAFMQQLIDTLGGTTQGMPPFIKDLRDSALAEQKGLQGWMNDHWLNGKPAMNVLGTFINVDYATFLGYQEGQMGQFVQNANMVDWLNDFRHEQIADLEKRIKDPFELMIALLAMISGEGQDILTGIGGQSNVLNKITNGSNAISSIMNTFKQGNWTASSVKDFMDKLVFNIRLPGDETSAYPQSVKDQLKSATDFFFNMKDGNGYSMLQSYMAYKQDGNINHLNDIANTLNNLGPNPADPHKDLSVWTQSVNTFVELAKSVSGVSPSIVQLVDAQQKNSDALNGFIKQAQDGINKTNDAVIQNTR